MIFCAMKFRASLLRYATGNHLNFNEDSVLVASQPMTPECFNYFEIRCGRGNDLAVALSEYVDLELCVATLRTVCTQFLLDTLL